MTTLPPELTTRQGVWSRYWQGRAPDGPSGSFAPGHDSAALTGWWRSVFAEHAAAARWLDLASGNGAVPALWLAGTAGAGLRCDAVDLASTPPRWVGSLTGTRRLTWHAAVNIEALPFPPAVFDVITSQYGVEYSALDRSVAEALRVLSPTGSLRLVLHHADSRPVQLARVELQYLAELLQPAGLWALGCQLTAPYARSGTPAGRAALALDAEANSLRLRFNAAEQALRGSGLVPALPEMHAETARALAEMFGLAVSQGVDAARAFAAHRESLLHDQRFRLLELTERALTLPALEALCQQLQASGLRVAHGALHEGSDCMGWWLKADRIRS